MESFLAWFHANHGTIDSTAMGITSFPGHGYGGIALRDIPEGHTIFTIPRALTLSTRTSELPRLLGPEVWKSGLDKGWSGLILCMMWEESRGPSSKWFEYLASLPTAFDTPMFWGAEDLAELEGTSLVGKIGRDDAERDYRETVVPAMQSRPDLFPLTGADHFSLERYHIMGSRILSRSFQVERWEGEGEDAEDAAANTSGHSAMDVDEEPPSNVSHADGDQENVDSDSESEEEGDDPSDVAMVPMADILNARYGSENAKLYYEESELKMVSTKPIAAGEQIWNTYGDLPNSDLLRRYGHVDLVPLANGGTGNPADVVEVRADLIVSMVAEKTSDVSPESSKARIDWWLDEGGDDVFVLEEGLDLPVPEASISLVRLLQLPEAEWEKARDKRKPPKPKVDIPVLSVLISALQKRSTEYPTSIEDDEALLSHPALTLNKRHAVIVRLGEKRLLKEAERRLTAMEQLLRLDDGKGKEKERSKKRKGERSEEGQVKRSKR
ncbi:hypothetical protein PLICRDRAFT_103395 [Plicaturopsis crispa FD-325 SS-3]|nr:hypothetical protein PLICRDRAFT_103395 [Plicaturopsis crispa FD-325 SS-3]